MTMTNPLAAFCTSRGIHIREASEDRVVLDSVPVNGDALSKPRTNLLVIRDAATSQFVVWADADLKASPDSPQLARLLTGQVKSGWQLLGHSQGFASADEAIAKTLELLNSDGMDKPTDERPLPGNVLPGVAAPINLHQARPELWHRDGVIELASRLFLDGPGMVVLAGPSGSGLTSIALEVLALCHGHVSGQAPDWLIRIDGALVATEMLYPVSTDERFRRLLAECLAIPGAWFLLDNVQWPLRGGPLTHAALSVAIERGLKGIATFQTDFARAADVLPGLVRRLHWLELPALDSLELTEILVRRGGKLSAAHDLKIEPEAIQTCRHLSGNGPGADPARSLVLLEAAAALALGSKPGRVGPDEVSTVETLANPQN